MKAFITKVIQFLKRIFLSIRAVVSLHIGIKEDTNLSDDQDTSEERK